MLVVFSFNASKSKAVWAGFTLDWYVQLFHNSSILNALWVTLAVSALAAVKLCPPVADYLLASHVSGEPAGALILEALGKKPLICAGMRLGEGTGAVAAMPLLDMALVIYREMGTFDDLSIDAYEHLS